MELMSSSHQIIDTDWRLWFIYKYRKTWYANRNHPSKFSLQSLYKNYVLHTFPGETPYSIWIHSPLKKFIKIPLGSFQYKYWFIMKKIVSFSFIDLALVLLNPRGTCKFYKTYTISLYQGDKVKCVITCNPEYNWFEWLDKKFNCKDSQF